jgi:hypothetical protein
MSPETTFLKVFKAPAATSVHHFVQVSRWRGSSVIDGSALALPMFYTIPSLFPTS